MAQTNSVIKVTTTSRLLPYTVQYNRFFSSLTLTPSKTQIPIITTHSCEFCSISMN